MSGKYALIIANTEYTDPGLAQLTAPGKDAEDFARVLGNKDICAFDDVKVLVNEHSNTVNEAIDEFFDQKKPDDLLLLYFSGHGVRDELGMLYLAVKNTNRYRLRVSAIKSDFIKESMDQSRSRRQVLILDCCNSGAFAQGTKAATGVSIGTASAFEAGYGRVILTASDSTQYAWEGDKVIGDTDNSLFTHYLVEGLEGNADRDGDGQITVDELYDYTYAKVRLATPKQTPSKFSDKQQGEIILRENIRIEDIKPFPLPDDLITAINSSLTFVREGAVRQLEDLLKGRNRGLARTARDALVRIAEDDDSKTISRAAFQALESVRQAEKQVEEGRIAKVGQETEQLAEKKRLVEEVEKQRITAQKGEEERLAEEKRFSEEAEKKQIATKTASSKQVVQQRTFLKVSTVSVIGICVLAVGVLGVWVIFNQPAATPTPEERVESFPTQGEATKTPPIETSTEIVSLTPTNIRKSCTFIWDISHGVYLGYQPSQNFSTLVAELESEGCHIEESVQGVQNTDLDQYTGIVISTVASATSSYTSNEANTIYQFVKEGGGLVILFENPTATGGTNIQEIANLFQIPYPTIAIDGEVKINNPTNHPVSESITSLVIISGGVLNTSRAGFQVVAFQEPDNPLAIAGTFEAGKVVAVGDSNMWDNSYIDKADNLKFAINVFNWAGK